MKDKSITVEDYEKYSGEFFDKYFYVAKQLGEGAKAEDILKIMESLGAVVMKKRMEDEGKIGPFGFIRDQIETTSGAPVINTRGTPPGTVAIKQKWAAYDMIKTESKTKLEDSFGGTIEKDIPDDAVWIDDALHQKDTFGLYTNPKNPFGQHFITGPTEDQFSQCHVGILNVLRKEHLMIILVL